MAFPDMVVTPPAWSGLMVLGASRRVAGRGVQGGGPACGMVLAMELIL